MSDLVKVGECEDVHGDQISFHVRGGVVFVVFVDPDGEAERRDQFIKLWAEAERRAEAVSGG